MSPEAGCGQTRSNGFDTFVLRRRLRVCHVRPDHDYRTNTIHFIGDTTMVGWL